MQMYMKEDSDIQYITEELIARLMRRAGESPRLRINHNFHPDMESNPHRFLNVMLRGTYIAPHRHLNPPKAESFLVLRGEVAFFLFDEEGRVTRKSVLGTGPRCEGLGIDIAPGYWHTLVVLSESVVCYEVKPGPYRPQDDKEFAPWAPREGDPEQENYLKLLLSE